MDWSAENYKQQHELFVSDHSGTGVGEIATVLLCPPLAILFRNMALPWLHTPQTGILVALLRDFCFLVLPVLGAMTVLSSHLDAVLVPLATAAVCLAIGADKLNASGVRLPPSLDVAMAGRRPPLVWLRAVVLIGTAVGILAVDFHVWPRRFCKAETYGTGLMDAGVGSFVVVNGIVAPHATGKALPGIASVRAAVKSSLPLCALGLVRLAVVKAADYHEHVTEYGVHWNFFFTLALVKVAAAAMLSVCGASRAWLLAVVVAVGHQAALSGFELRQFVLFGADGHGSRDGFLDANREGVFSLPGYVAIYLASVTLGRFIMKRRETLRAWLKAFFVLLGADAGLWGLFYLCDGRVEKVSRRLANAAYVVWILAYSLQLLTSLVGVDLVCSALRYTTFQLKPLTHKRKPDASPSSQFCLLEAISRNALAYFLLANLLTGAVNLAVHTLDVDDTVAVAVLAGYMLVLTAAVTLLHRARAGGLRG